MKRWLVSIEWRICVFVIMLWIIQVNVYTFDNWSYLNFAVAFFWMHWALRGKTLFDILIEKLIEKRSNEEKE